VEGERTKERSFMPPLTVPLAAATVRTEITSELKRRGVGGDDLHDLVQETLARAFALHDRPRSLDQCTTLARVIARNVAVDHLRRAIVRSRYDSNADPDDQLDADELLMDARDPVDRCRQLALMKREADRGSLSRRALAIVLAVSESVAQTEIAAELGVCHQTVRNDLWRARKSFQAAWSALETSMD
jgi:RNA polymerase sigma factor (sigma-70 family)